MTCAVFIEGVTADEVVAHLRERVPGVRELEERCIFEYVSGRQLVPRAAVADVVDEGQRWTELWDPDYEGLLMRDLGPGRRPCVPLGRRAFAFVGGYAFFYYLEGELVRSAVRNNDEITEAFGTPLPEESKVQVPVWGFDQSCILQLMTLLGFGFPKADPSGGRYRILERWTEGTTIPAWATGTPASPTAPGATLTADEEAKLRKAFGIDAE
jgi:hypothetical protein